MVDERERERLAQAKDASVGQLLFKAARLFEDQALARLRATSGMPIRSAHTRLFPHIDLEGTRLTVLARRAGISKQAAGQLVDDLVAMGALERVPDPDDGRAKRIRFGRRDGELGLFQGLRVLGELEGELRTSLGDADWEALHTGLRRLVATLSETS
jgi:DNA-binding MarR family transcriptional regulator